MSEVARTADRHDLADVVRIRLLEKDADVVEAELVALDERLGKILWALVGILISTTTASVLLALNLAVAR